MSDAHSLFRGRLFVSILLLGLSALCFGQATSSAISGVVRDPSQAVIAGATVTVTNRGTGISRTSPSDTAGRYRVGELQPGTYQVTVTMAGFATETHKDIVLMVGQELPLNFTLQVGAVEQQVEVTGVAPVVETTTATVSGGVTQEQLRELPLNGRSFTDLVVLQAGTVAPTSGTANLENGNGPQLSIGGARSDYNSFMIDGTDMSHVTGFTPGSAAGVQLGVDTIREYQVITSNAKAEHGRNAGGIINAVTRSGTNEWHGSAFEFLRNDALDARNFFDKEDAPPFKRNQFGVTFGGPILRDKTFFFLGYEGLRQRLTQTFVYNVPTATARQGIGVLPAGVSVDPRVVPYLNLFPLPNGPILPGGTVGNFITTVSQPTNENYGSARIDHNFSSNDFLFGRYTISRGDQIAELNLLTKRPYESSNQYVTVQEDHIFTPTLLNTFRVGLNRSLIRTTLAEVPGAPLSLGFVPGHPMGQLSVGGLSPLGPAYITNPIFWVVTSFQFEDTLSATRGAHALKFGALVQRYRWNNDQSLTYRGVVRFSNLANFLQAGPVGTGVTLLLPGSLSYRHYRMTLLGFFAQDDYRVTPNLTLNYGLRWEFNTGMNETDELMAYLPNGPILTTFDGIGIGKFWDNRIGLLAPRLGFNWALGQDQKTSLSGGFGVYYNQMLSNSVVTDRIQPPFFRRANVSNLNATQHFPNILPLVLASGELFRETRVFDYNHIDSPVFYRYNLTIQRELPGQMALRVGYVGALGRHSQREQTLNDFPAPLVQPDGSLFFPPSTAPYFAPQKLNPDFDIIRFMGSDSNSAYNALAVSLRKQFSHGLLFQANYTWSQSIDDFSNNDASLVGIGRAGQFGPDRRLDRGRSLINVPHVFVVNGIYELPVGLGKRWLNTGGVANAILGGWQLGGILTVQQGIPFTALSSAPATGYRFTASRPNLKLGTDVGSLTQNGTPQRYFDPSAFTVPPPGTIGNAARGLMLGPPLSSMNFSFSKFFSFGEQMRLQFRGEFFNFLNHTNFSNPTGTVFTSQTGAINPAAGQITRTSTTSRQIQFGLKLTF